MADDNKINFDTFFGYANFKSQFPEPFEEPTKEELKAWRREYLLNKFKDYSLLAFYIFAMIGLFVMVSICGGDPNGIVIGALVGLLAARSR
jgi:hypothetical protein